MQTHPSAPWKPVWKLNPFSLGSLCDNSALLGGEGGPRPAFSLVRQLTETGEGLPAKICCLITLGFHRECSGIKDK